MNYRKKSEAEVEAEASGQLPMEVVDTSVRAQRELRPGHASGSRPT